jgi:hypothetical protein
VRTSAARAKKNLLASHITKGKLYATGYTKSNDWKTLRGTTDAFVVRLNAQTLAVEKTEYFGGSGADSAWGIAVDKHGRVFIAGNPTRSICHARIAGIRKRIAAGSTRSSRRSAAQPHTLAIAKG